MNLATAIAVPIIIFLVIVAPIWLSLHYRSQREANQGLNDEELDQLNELAHKAESLGERVKILESLLDVEAPGWREHQ